MKHAYILFFLISGSVSINLIEASNLYDGYDSEEFDKNEQYYIGTDSDYESDDYLEPDVYNNLNRTIDDNNNDNTTSESINDTQKYELKDNLLQHTNDYLLASLHSSTNSKNQASHDLTDQNPKLELYEPQIYRNNNGVRYFIMKPDLQSSQNFNGNVFQGEMKSISNKASNISYLKRAETPKIVIVGNGLKYYGIEIPVTSVYECNGPERKITKAEYNKAARNMVSKRK